MMRTKLIIGILIFIGINSGFSQEAGKVTSNRINEAVDSLHFEWVKNDSAFILQPRSTLDTNSYLSSYTLNVIEDDIVMQYSLKPKPRSVQRGISYYYSINVRGQLGDLSVSIGQHNAIFTPELKNGLSSRMVLINFMDKYPEWIQEGEQFQYHLHCTINSRILFGPAHLYFPTTTPQLYSNRGGCCLDDRWKSTIR
jgi:hypothetical protein